MTSKLTQKQLVNLFNTKMAPFHKEMEDAKSNYEKALAGFITETFGITNEEWKSAVSMRASRDSVIEVIAEGINDAPPTNHLLQESALGFMVANLEGEDEWMDLNTSV